MTASVLTGLPPTRTAQQGPGGPVRFPRAGPPCRGSRGRAPGELRKELLIRERGAVRSLSTSARQHQATLLFFALTGRPSAAPPKPTPVPAPACRVVSIPSPLLASLLLFVVVALQPSFLHSSCCGLPLRRARRGAPDTAQAAPRGLQGPSCPGPSPSVRRPPLWKPRT